MEAYISHSDFSSSHYVIQPRLQMYRKMDLSQNVEVWSNTDSDKDGLSNPRELELGTDMLNDGEEVANDSNPLRDENAAFVAFYYDGDAQ